MRGTLPFRSVALAAALIGLLALPAAAGASYAPKLTVSASPTNVPGSTIGFTSVVSQDASEDATKKAVVHFPLGVSLDLATISRTPTCAPEQRDAKACPENSRIGTATADTSLGQLTGGVYLGHSANIYIFLRNSTLALLGKEPGPITGTTVFRPDGGVDTVLDNLPTDITPTRFALVLDGPPKSVISGPPDCGTMVFVGEFTSKNGAVVTSRGNPITFTNCPPPPIKLTGVRISSRRLTIGGIPTITYTLSRAATIDLTIRRLGKRKVLGHKHYGAGAGTGRVRILTRRLTAGNYIITLHAEANNTSSGRSFVINLRRRR